MLIKILANKANFENKQEKNSTFSEFSIAPDEIRKKYRVTIKNDSFSKHILFKSNVLTNNLIYKHLTYKYY